MKTENNNNKNNKDKDKTAVEENDNSGEAKVIPLQPTDSATLGDKITVNNENEDILTPVNDDKTDY